MRFSLLSLLAAATGLVAAAPAPAAAPPRHAPGSLALRESTTTNLAQRDDSIMDVFVLFGDLWTSTLETTMNAVMDTQDNILFTEEQIGVMADRIVYVTELGMGGAVEVIYLVMGLFYLGMEGDDYTYKVAMMPVAALPEGWL